MMNILATYNLKGGVGKTAAAVNLAYCAVCAGRRVLLWDLDPQGAASFYYRIEPQLKGGSKKLIKRKHELDTYIKASNYAGLDLIPADFSNRKMDMLLSEVKKPGKRLTKLIKPLADDYDLVLLDCAPNISQVSESVFGAAEALLVPVIPTPLSLRAYEQVQNFCREAYPALVLLPFFSMLDRRRQLHTQTVEVFPATHPETLGSAIPYASVVEQMGVRRAPLGAFAAGSPAARAYVFLWIEIERRLRMLQGGQVVSTLHSNVLS